MSEDDIARLRAMIAEAARDELLPRFASIAHQYKRDGSLVTEADGGMQARVAGLLARAWPGIPLLGEEMSQAEQTQLIESTREGALWCLDPLDGTSNYAAGIPFFSVSLALLRAGRAELGLVYDPLRDECFTAIRGKGARLNGDLLPETARSGIPLGRAIACIDFKRLKAPLAAALAAHPPYASQRNFGSCALEWCWLAAGRFDLYVHGGQWPWDYAAGCLILAEAGGRYARIEGGPDEDMGERIQVTKRSTVATRNPKLFEAWLSWFAVHAVVPRSS